MYVLGYCCKLVVIKEQFCSYHVCFYVDRCNKSLLKKTEVWRLLPVIDTVWDLIILHYHFADQNTTVNNCTFIYSLLTLDTFSTAITALIS
jgi:hypothetical protein